MNNFERKFYMFVLALGLGDAIDFHVVGEEGKKNYQLLFSTLIEMIEKNGKEFFIDKQSKPQIIASLNRTIECYETQNPEELYQLMTRLEQEEPSSFMIIPAYINLSECDHMYGLILYAKEDHYIVTTIDKMRFGTQLSSSVSYSTIGLEDLKVLSEVLFSIKFDHHRDSKCNLKKIIPQFAQNRGAHNYLALNMRGYRGAANCPVIEPLATLRTALYNCQKKFLTIL